MIDFYDAYRVYVNVIEDENKKDKFLCFSTELDKLYKFIDLKQAIKLYYLCFEKYYDL